jgi:hypothetical protein
MNSFWNAAEHRLRAGGAFCSKRTARFALTAGGTWGGDVVVGQRGLAARVLAGPATTLLVTALSI